MRVEPNPDDNAHYSPENLFDSANRYPITADVFAEQEIETVIPDSAGYLAFGLLLDGEGCVDIDNVSLTTDP